MNARRYLAVVQDARGYPPPGQRDQAPPDGPGHPIVHATVLADDYEALEAERDRYRQIGDHMQSEASRLAEWVVRNIRDMPYEVGMALVATQDCIKQWTAARSATNQEQHP